jgi:Tfp pilus assembly PilM family ATPase
VKRSIQTSAPGYFVGIEFDSKFIRGARLSSDGRGSFAVSALEEQTGDYADDSALIEGLKQLKGRLGVGVRDHIASCLAGKQVFAAHMDFRKLSGAEMEQALRLELRKIVHFEVATSSLDFEILEETEDTGEGKCQVMVALASNSLLTRQMRIMERASFRTTAMDVFPLAVANALWAWRGIDGMETPSIAMHVGSQTSTIVIDGEYSPFFNRSIPFVVEEIKGNDAPVQERIKRLQSLADEVSRSLAFHEKSSGIGGFRELVLLGDRLEDAEFADAIKRRTGLDTVRMDLAGKFGGHREAEQHGRFDLAIALALRGDA